MAKKRKKEKKEESYEFKEPEFDEEEFLRKEVRDAKALFVTIGYAALIALVSFSLASVDVALGALVGFIGIIFLRHIYPQIGVDTSLIEKKSWAGNIIMYLFTWLAVWILLSNPPFSDLAAPTIYEDGIYFGSPGNWTNFDPEEHNLTFGMNISINATVADNVKVDEDTIMITVKRREGENYMDIESGPMIRIGKYKYAYVLFDIGQGEYKYTITAIDVNNNKKSFSGPKEPLNVAQ